MVNYYVLNKKNEESVAHFQFVIRAIIYLTKRDLNIASDLDGVIDGFGDDEYLQFKKITLIDKNNNVIKIYEEKELSDIVDFIISKENYSKDKAEKIKEKVGILFLSEKEESEFYLRFLFSDEKEQESIYEQFLQDVEKAKEDTSIKTKEIEVKNKKYLYFDLKKYEAYGFKTSFFPIFLAYSIAQDSKIKISKVASNGKDFTENGIVYFFYESVEIYNQKKKKLLLNEDAINQLIVFFFQMIEKKENLLKELSPYFQEAQEYQNLKKLSYICEFITMDDEYAKGEVEKLKEKLLRK